MDKDSKKGIILQARMGSSRLPAKMAKKFDDNKTLLEVVIQRVLSVSGNVPVIVVTTGEKEDDFIEDLSKSLGVLVYRGSELDVMSRFVEAAEVYNIESIIRICADNPFLQTHLLVKLLEQKGVSDLFYMGFRLLNSLPAIKSHLGFFPEMVSARALQIIHNQTLDSIYKEHVTNYFYSEANQSFPVKWIDLNYSEEFVKNVRLTIDTEEDFYIANNLYMYFKSNNMNGTDKEIFEKIKRESELLNRMKKIIAKNEK